VRLYIDVTFRLLDKPGEAYRYRNSSFGPFSDRAEAEHTLRTLCNRADVIDGHIREVDEEDR
jgi:hypothetical protein